MAEQARMANQPGPLTDVGGSLLWILQQSVVATLVPKLPDDDLGPYPNIHVDERPEQANLYPVIVIRVGKAQVIEETFEGHKVKEYAVNFEISATTREEASNIGREIEKVLEDPLTPGKIALFVGAFRTDDDEGVQLVDNGEVMSREFKKYDPNAARTYVLSWDWGVTVKYLSTPLRGEPGVAN